MTLSLLVFTLPRWAITFLLPRGELLRYTHFKLNLRWLHANIKVYAICIFHLSKHIRVCHFLHAITPPSNTHTSQTNSKINNKAWLSQPSPWLLITAHWTCLCQQHISSIFQYLSATVCSVCGWKRCSACRVNALPPPTLSFLSVMVR